MGLNNMEPVILTINFKLLLVTHLTEHFDTGSGVSVKKLHFLTDS
jgi:hypothetical protein